MEKLTKESLDLEAEALTALDKKFRDNSGASTSGDTGPIYDIIRYFKFTQNKAAWYKYKISFLTKIICFGKRVTVYN